MCALTPNTETGGYDGYLEVTIKGTGTTGFGHIEKHYAGQFSLLQNYPNSYTTTTHIPFHLIKPGFVGLALFDLSGKK